jgi:hypothetical protein
MNVPYFDPATFYPQLLITHSNGTRTMYRITMLLTSILIAATITISPVLLSASVASAAPSPQLPTSIAKTLGVKWWQWAFSFPTNESPLSDTTGERCGLGDQGKRFFLAGTAGPISSTQTRNCTISHNDAILIPVGNAACIIGHLCAENVPVANQKQLKEQVKFFADLIVVHEASITIDGGQTIELQPGRAQSPFFKTSVVPNNPFSEPPIEN